MLVDSKLVARVFPLILLVLAAGAGAAGSPQRCEDAPRTIRSALNVGGYWCEYGHHIMAMDSVPLEAAQEAYLKAVVQCYMTEKHTSVASNRTQLARSSVEVQGPAQDTLTVRVTLEMNYYLDPPGAHAARKLDPEQRHALAKEHGALVQYPLLVNDWNAQGRQVVAYLSASPKQQAQGGSVLVTLFMSQVLPLVDCHARLDGGRDLDSEVYKAVVLRSYDRFSEGYFDFLRFMSDWMANTAESPLRSGSRRPDDDDQAQAMAMLQLVREGTLPMLL